MPIAVDREDICLAQGYDAVDQHAFAVAEYRREGQIALMVLARDNLVNAIVCEQLWPFLKSIIIYPLGVDGVEFGCKMLQAKALENGGIHLRPHRLVDRCKPTRRRS